MATTLGVTETYGLSDDKVRDFKEAFDYFSENEGLYEELFTKNLVQHLSDMGYDASTAELAQFRLACDVTATGKYTFDGFLKVISKILKTGDMEDVLKQAFRIFDKEGTGSISTDLVRNLLKEPELQMTHEEIEQLITETDADGSGEVDFEEFKEMMMGD
ncbi:calmodulin-A-like [Symsagittifera roscoffensis]|uniref:calmodulin-A-like n=1 Tax=Symsagittifera roscoffensis TaxID=84072 RepID=UPI00307B394C